MLEYSKKLAVLESHFPAGSALPMPFRSSAIRDKKVFWYLTAGTCYLFDRIHTITGIITVVYRTEQVHSRVDTAGVLFRPKLPTDFFFL